MEWCFSALGWDLLSTRRQAVSTLLLSAHEEQNLYKLNKVEH